MDSLPLEMLRGGPFLFSLSLSLSQKKTKNKKQTNKQTKKQGIHCHEQFALDISVGVTLQMIAAGISYSVANNQISTEAVMQQLMFIDLFFPLGEQKLDTRKFIADLLN